MKVKTTSLFADIPKALPSELCQTLLNKPNLRLERIVSRGHCSEKDFWYDQAWDEWVCIFSGAAKLEWFDGAIIELFAGDYLLIPAHCKHRVAWTMPDQETIWLAIHFTEKDD